MHNRKIEKRIAAYILFKNYCFIWGVTLFIIFITFAQFKITDYKAELVVTNKSLSLKAPTISVDQK